eukprot:m.179494 g.179494  ORF g.179494 m.179494 type:complete len:372 (-) comp13569_c1_seq1:6938-8053(-)
MDIDGLRMATDGFDTVSTQAQLGLEDDIVNIYKRLEYQDESLVLDVESHIRYAKGGLKELPSAFVTLDASKPWLIYWNLNSISLLGGTISAELRESVISTLLSYQCDNGGFGGGADQLHHLAPTYAAVNALAIIGDENALKQINRDAMITFLKSMVQEDGSVIMHEGGETDIRGAYCAAVVASLLGLDLKDIFKNVPEWIAKCQTYEGGFSATPNLEAHGGYTFCGVGAALLLNATNLIDMDMVLDWTAHRQMRLSGGFQGRTHKLVDGCYSFWVGAVFPMVAMIFGEDSLVNAEGLVKYVLGCCQMQHGLRDKPGKRQDYYHTAYCLAGLGALKFSFPSMPQLAHVNETHPIYNIRPHQVDAMKKLFSKQ